MHNKIFCRLTSVFCFPAQMPFVPRQCGPSNVFMCQLCRLLALNLYSLLLSNSHLYLSFVCFSGAHLARRQEPNIIHISHTYGRILCFSTVVVSNSLARVACESSIHQFRMSILWVCLWFLVEFVVYVWRKSIRRSLKRFKKMSCLLIG